MYSKARRGGQWGQIYNFDNWRKLMRWNAILPALFAGQRVRISCAATPQLDAEIPQQSARW